MRKERNIFGLGHDVDEYPVCVQEVLECSTARELRGFFATLILHGAPAPHHENYFRRICLLIS